MSSSEPTAPVGPSKGAAWNIAQQVATTQFQGSSKRPWTETEDAMLIAGREAKRSWLELAVQLRRTWFSAQGRAAYLRKRGRWPLVSSAA